MNGIYLTFSSLEIKRRLRIHKSFFTLSEKKPLTNLQKQQLQKKFFFSVYFIGIIWINECILFHVITERHKMLSFL